MQATRALREQWDTIKGPAEERLAPELRTLADSAERYRGELRKAGVAV
jgi:hypothetical protein